MFDHHPSPVPCPLQGMCVRETKAIIGKAQKLGIHTPKSHAAVRPCESFAERNIERNTSGTQLNKKF